MENKKNKKVTVIIISIFIVIILVLGLTFAYLRTELSGSEEIVKVGTLDLVLNETSEGISLNNAVGISDSQGMSTTPSTFELKNNGDKAVDYIIYLDDNTIGDTDTRIDDRYLKYNLNKNGENSGASLLTSIGSNPNRILDMGTIEGRGTNKYSLNLWISDEVDGNYSGQVFSGKLRVEVSQEKDKSVAGVLLRNLPEENINTTDPEQTFITGEEPNNYIWYSGKLWRAVSIDQSDNSVKLVTQWTISTIPYDDDSSAFEGSHMEQWLNDTTADGFLGNLREPEKFIKMNSKWNATQCIENGIIAKPDKTILVEDPVGLLNMYEYTMSYSGLDSSMGYLNDGLYWWTLTPVGDSNVGRVVWDGAENFVTITSPAGYGVRPSVNLLSNIKIVDGSGTEEDPYRLEGDNDKDLFGTSLKTRYSGEYIRFGTGGNNLYRIVSHETSGLTKITSTEPLKENGYFKKISFGNDINYSSTNNVGSFLNNDYLNPNNGYLTAKQINMISDNTIWYLGTVGLGENYRLAKYTDTSMSGTTANITNAKVGLLRFGELMAGQFNRYSLKGETEASGLVETYILITPSSSSQITYVGYLNDVIPTLPNRLFAFKPVFNLKEDVIITGGDGTLQNPFEVELAS